MKRLRLQMAVSGYRQGKWSPKKISKDFYESADEFSADIVRDQYQLWALDTAEYDGRFTLHIDGYGSDPNATSASAVLSGCFELSGCRANRQNRFCRTIGVDGLSHCSVLIGWRDWETLSSQVDRSHATNMPPTTSSLRIGPGLRCQRSNHQSQVHGSSHSSWRHLVSSRVNGLAAFIHGRSVVRRRPKWGTQGRKHLCRIVAADVLRGHETDFPDTPSISVLQTRYHYPAIKQAFAISSAMSKNLSRRGQPDGSVAAAPVHGSDGAGDSTRPTAVGATTQTGLPE